jgi:predicted small metal-binding protein
MDKSNQDLTGCSQMTLSLNCKEAGGPVCTRHTMYGETEEELLADAKKHGIDVHGYTEETWNEEVAKNADNFRKLIKSVSDTDHNIIRLEQYHSHKI